jgi:homoserine acetyltransferase
MAQKQNNSIRLKEEMEFLNQIKEMEELDNFRRIANIKAINQDFVNSNANLQQEKANQRVSDFQSTKRERNTYFPFVSGDILEKHRANLSLMQKNDFQNYLNYKKEKELQRSNKGSPFSMTAKTEMYDPTEQSNFDATLTSVRRKPRMLKQLFDSEYVKPSENFRVIQDTDPRKHAVYNEALKRYEEQLKQQGVEM